MIPIEEALKQIPKVAHQVQMEAGAIPQYEEYPQHMQIQVISTLESLKTARKKLRELHDQVVEDYSTELHREVADVVGTVHSQERYEARRRALRAGWIGNQMEELEESVADQREGVQDEQPE